VLLGRGTKMSKQQKPNDGHIKSIYLFLNYFFSFLA